MPARAVILAAGRGTRFGDRAKPLIELHGELLIERNVRFMAEGGVRDLVVVTGHRADEVEERLEPRLTPLVERVRFVRNERVDTSNGISAKVGASVIDAPYILTMGDHVFDREIVLRATSAAPRSGVLVFVDPRPAGVYDLEDATRVQLDENDRVVRIGKSLADFQAVDIGLFVCTKELAGAFEGLAREQPDATLSHGIQRLAGKGRAFAERIDGPWVDVDDPAALRHAEGLFA